MAFIRDLFTGELKEVEHGAGGRQILYRSPQPTNRVKRYANPWDQGKDHVCRPLSLLPELATPERIEAENAAARHHGTGAYYTPDGMCHLPTRGARSREMARERSDGSRRQDNDGCYGDYCGR